MPLTYTVEEQIARELYRRLRLMLSSTSYQTKVRSVIRPTRLGNFTPDHLQIVLTMGETVEVDELMYPGNPVGLARELTFNIHCHLLTDENSSTAIDQEVSQFAADVQKAVCIPAATWHTFDGNAIDAAWKAKELINADGGIDGVNLPLTVLYRVSELDPYATRL
jgi:hypothetical protein